MYRLAGLLGLGLLALACSSPPAPTGSQNPHDTSGDDDDDKKKSSSASPVGSGSSSPAPAASASPASSSAAVPSPNSPNASASASAVPIPGTQTTPTPANTCQTALDLGKVNADDDGAPLTASGTCTQWLHVRAVESDNGFFGSGMSLRLTLQSPPSGGTDFTLTAFMNRNQDVQDCGPLAIAVSEQPGASPRQIQFSWGEGAVANDDDDSRSVAILVKSVTGACGTQPWQLLVEGHKD
jgi:hypothetical protein